MCCLEFKTLKIDKTSNSKPQTTSSYPTSAAVGLRTDQEDNSSKMHLHLHKVAFLLHSVHFTSDLNALYNI